jgi:phage baseplate assembly protein W
LARKTDEEAVKEAINNLIFTDRGERPFQPLLGCDIKKMLFENITPSNIELMKSTIRATLRNYEPRANVLDVDVKANADTNQVTVIIVFNLINSEDDIVFTRTLSRVR